MPNFKPEHIILAYVAIEVIKFVINKGIAQRKQMEILREISLNMRDTSKIMRSILTFLSKEEKHEKNHFSKHSRSSTDIGSC